MADEANTQETTTENSTVDADTNSTESVDNTEVSGGDVQATETETTEVESEKSDKTVDPEIARLNRELEKVRTEAARNRVKGNEKAEQAAKDAAKQATEDLVKSLGKTLGLIQDDTPPDPAELLRAAEERTAQIAAERDANAEKLRNYARKDALAAAANSKEIDGDLNAILDSVSVNDAIKKLDTNADDFAAQVAAIVSAAVENNPKLKKATAQVAAPRSGGDLSGGNGAPKPTGDKTIDDLRREKRERAKREQF